MDLPVVGNLMDPALVETLRRKPLPWLRPVAGRAQRPRSRLCWRRRGTVSTASVTFLQPEGIRGDISGHGDEPRERRFRLGGLTTAAGRLGSC